MKIGLASESNLPKAYKATTSDDGETVTLQAGSAKLAISTNSFQSVTNILALFAQDGKATLEPGTTFYIRDGFSDKETTVTANAIKDVAASLASFAVKPGEYLPAMKDEEEVQGGGETAVEPKSTTAAGRSREPEPQHNEPAPSSHGQAIAAAEITDKSAPTKCGRKATQKSEETTIAASAPSDEKIATTSTAETAVSDQAAAEKPDVQADGAPAKRRGRPPKNRAVAETEVKASQAKAEKAPKGTKSAAPAKTVSVTPIVRKPHSSGGPFPAAMTENRKSAEITGDVPAFIKELKAYYIIGDDNDFRFDFTALEMEPGKRRSVLGPAETYGADSTFGYEVKSKAGEHIGWIIIEAENKFVMTGIPEMDVSSHRNIEGPITKTGIAIANKIATIRAKAA